MYHTEKVNASLRHRDACINLYVLWPNYPPDVIVEVSPDDSGKFLLVAESHYFRYECFDISSFWMAFGVV